MGANATPKAGVCRSALRESPKNHGYYVAPLANIWILPARRALSPCFWGALNVTEFTTGYTSDAADRFRRLGHTHYIDYRYVRAAEPCRSLKADQRKPEKETPL